MYVIRNSYSTICWIGGDKTRLTLKSGDRIRYPATFGSYDDAMKTFDILTNMRELDNSDYDTLDIYELTKAEEAELIIEKLQGY